MSPAQQPPSPPAPPPSSAAQPSAAAANARVFGAETGVIFSAIKPDRVDDFESVLDRLRQGLAASKDPVRRQQALGWKIFKAAEAGPAGSVLYVFLMSPVVKGADYGVARILAEEFPAEAQDLYRAYNGAFASGQTLLNLQPLPAPPPGPTPSAGASAPAVVPDVMPTRRN